MADDCNRRLVPSPSNPTGIPKKGDVLIFNIDPPIRYPCHEKVIVVRGAQLQQESGNSFQVKMTADHSLVEVVIWCNALISDEREGNKVCEIKQPLVLGKNERYVDCLLRCLTDLAPAWGVGALQLALVGLLVGAILGGVLGLVVGGYAGLLIPPAAAAAYCSVKCFFETL